MVFVFFLGGYSKNKSEKKIKNCTLLGKKTKKKTKKKIKRKNAKIKRTKVKKNTDKYAQLHVFVFCLLCLLFFCFVALKNYFGSLNLWLACPT